MVKAVELTTLHDHDVTERMAVELRASPVLEGDEQRLIQRTLILLGGDDLAVAIGEGVEFVADHEAQVLEPHRIAGPVGRRN